MRDKITYDNCQSGDYFIIEHLGYQWCGKITSVARFQGEPTVIHYIRFENGKPSTMFEDLHYFPCYNDGRQVIFYDDIIQLRLVANGELLNGEVIEI